MATTVEIEYEDGTRATWELTEAGTQLVESTLIVMLGQPDTIKC